MKNIAIDFDGVIHQHLGSFGDGEIKYPIVDGARDALRELTAKGFQVLIFSTRVSPTWADWEDQKSKMIQWLSSNGIEPGSHYHLITGCKIPAIAYIDDRAIRFTNWNDIKNYFN